MGTKTSRQLASELGISLSTLQRQIGDGEIPSPARLSKRRVGWFEEDAASIIANKRRKPIAGPTIDGPPTKEELAEIWKALLNEFVASPDYRASLSLAEAVSAAAVAYPQLAALLGRAAEHEGLTPRKLKPVDYVVFQIHTGQWVRCSDFSNGSAEVYIGRSKEDALRPPPVAGLPKGKG